MKIRLFVSGNSKKKWEKLKLEKGYHVSKFYFNVSIFCLILLPKLYLGSKYGNLTQSRHLCHPCRVLV